jgi:chemotaxis protein histidine kinase CheA
MGIMDKKDFQDAFKKEAGSLMNKIGKELYRTYNDSRISRLFRYAHTLKGISGTCGYYKIEEAAGSMMEIFRTAKDGKFEISPGDKILIVKNLKECGKLLKKSSRGNHGKTKI